MQYELTSVHTSQWATSRHKASFSGPCPWLLQDVGHSGFGDSHAFFWGSFAGIGNGDCVHVPGGASGSGGLGADAQNCGTYRPQLNDIRPPHAQSSWTVIWPHM